MTDQEKTIASLETAKGELTALIAVANPAVGTDAWKQLEALVKKREEISAQLQTLEDAVFQPDPALAPAIDALDKASASLGDLADTLDQLDTWIARVGLVVQAAASVIAIIGVV